MPVKNNIDTREFSLRKGQVTNTQAFRNSLPNHTIYWGTAPYKYTGGNHSALSVPDRIGQLADTFEKILELPNGYFNMILSQYYKSGKGLGKHRDNEPEITPLSTIASVSLGAERVFIITKGYREKYLELLLEDGDVLYMFGRSQMDFYHSVERGYGTRHNITFRHNANAPVRPKTRIANNN